MVVLPSDHLLEGGELWETTIRLGCETARTGRLVTIGLTPDRPETGYGYIRTGERLNGLALGDLQAYSVAEFVEKPDAETALEYLEDGSYLWNSGMLVARAADVIEELEAAGKAAATEDSKGGELVARSTSRLAADGVACWNGDDARQVFSQLPAVPFDKAVLEVSGRVAVVPSPMNWSDVGSLLSLEDVAPPDDRGNTLVGNVADVDSTDSVVYSEDRLVATLGLSDVLVVDTSDATLVAAKERAQDVRLIVDRLRESGAPEVTKPHVSLRPWGSWTMLLKSEGFQIKSIDVAPGQRLSLQSHERRSEHWIVVEGTAAVERDGKATSVPANESVFIPIGCRHRLANEGDGPLRVIEVAVGDYLEEDDIVRYDDDWGRCG
jgi:mannose-1-phosphate guanylyltransferase/mannose-6-phosphate isomerase